MAHHRGLDRAFVSQAGYTEIKCIGCKVGPPQKAGSITCITHWRQRNEMQWVQVWSTTESCIEHLYHIGYTEMKCSGCKVGPPQRVGSSTCITHWLHRNEILWVQGWSTTESWIEHLSRTGYTDIKCSWCKAGAPQRIGPSICITSWLHRNEMQCVQSWSTTENWIEHLYVSLWLHRN